MSLVEVTESQVFPAEKREFLRRHYARESTPEEFEHFASVCRTRGLSPEANQIYFMKVSGRASIVLSINAYRLIAQRTGAYAGTSPVEYTYDAKGDLQSATVTVQKFVQGQLCNFSGTALLNEHIRLSRDGRKSLWDSMPATMLEKCAEAKALRKAFPEELSSFYTRDEIEGAEQLSQSSQRTLAKDIVTTSDPKVADWIRGKLKEANIPETEWSNVIDSLNGYPKGELLLKLKAIMSEISAKGEPV